MDDLLIELSWSSTSLAEEFGEPDSFIYRYYGDVIGINEDDSHKIIGRFRAQYIDVGRAINEQESIFDVLDSYSSSTAEYFEPIFGDNSPEFSDEVDEISSGDYDGCNLLILDRIEVIPKYRGKLIGLKVLRHMMLRFSAGAGIIALKAFPLQHECEPHDKQEQSWRKKLSLNCFAQDEELSTLKLKSYYERLGFQCLPDSNFMIFATGWKIPSLKSRG